MEEKVIPVLSKTIKINRVPDVGGFIQAMKDMGAKVTTVIDLRHPKEKKEVKHDG